MKNTKIKDKRNLSKKASKPNEDKDNRQPKGKVADTNLSGTIDFPGRKRNNIGRTNTGVRGTIISPSDDEAEDAFRDNIDQEITGQDTEVSEEEQNDLFLSANDMPGDDEELREAALDSTDEEGAPLNEDSFYSDISADDLDVPGTSLDDRDEEIGEEDEENNEYSLGNEDQDDDSKDE